jgi:hypothetical protein
MSSAIQKLIAFRYIFEFESHYKMAQFLQLISMFKQRISMTRRNEIPAELHEGTRPIENQVYLIPPSIANKFVSEPESPSNNQDL